MTESNMWIKERMEGKEKKKEDSYD